MKQIVLPEKVQTIINRLSACGFEAYAVGGCVRDTLLGRTPDDWDLTTNAKPLEIKSVFSHTVDTGIAHGTVTVLIDREPFEVTTYRTDGEYLDHRHPASVVFVPDLREDLSRRDFTINAMAYNDETGLVDLFGGEEDLEKHVIRCVGEPAKRFCEDALRMLRALRFSAQLGFAMDPATEDAIRTLNSTIREVSKERIQTELVKLLLSDHPERLKSAKETGLLSYFLPEAAAWFDETRTIWGQPVRCVDLCLRELSCSLRELPVRLAIILSGCEDRAKTILKGLKFDNHTIANTVQLLRMMNEEVAADPVCVRTILSRYGEKTFCSYLDVRMSQNEALCVLMREKMQDPQIKALWQKEKQDVDTLRKIYDKTHADGDCVSLSELALTGSDLMELGVPEGKKLGEDLRELLLRVIEEPERNNREWLSIYVKEHFIQTIPKGEKR